MSYFNTILLLIVFFTCSVYSEKVDTYNFHKIESNSSINLIDHWEFFWDQLLVVSDNPTLEIKNNCVFNIFSLETSPNCNGYKLSKEAIEILTSQRQGTPIKVPHSWEEESRKTPIEKRGKAIYKIKLSSPSGRYGFYVRNWVTNSSARFWIYSNGNLIFKEAIGSPGVSESTSREMAGGLFFEHTFPEGDSELLIEVSNYGYRYGYLTGQLYASNSDTAKREYLKYILLEANISGFLLMCGMYHFFLFFLRRKLVSIFWFGLFCTTLSIRVAVIARFYQIINPMTDSYPFMNRIEYILILITPLIFIIYLRNILQTNILNLLYKFILYYTLLAILSLFIFSSYQFSTYFDFYQFPAFLSIIYATTLIFSKVNSDDSTIKKIARALIGVYILFALSLLHDIFMYKFHWIGIELSGIGMTLFILGQSYVIARMNANALETSERLTIHLEKEVAIRTQQYKEEYAKSEKLLLNILPKKIANELKINGKIEPESFDSVTVCFTDFVGFTQIAEKMTPAKLVEELDICFSHFDDIIDFYKLEKLKTIGDSYMFAGGIPSRSKTHAIDCILAALKIQNFLYEKKLEKQSIGEDYWQLRLGINSGSLVAGVIGNKKFAYDIWSDTVNTASRCESSGLPGKINISETTYSLVKDFFICESRGKIPAKNKGKMEMFTIISIRDELSKNGEPNQKFNDLYNALKNK
jgi:class 3 adenylate cyclase